MDEEFPLFKVPLDELVFGAIGQCYQEFRVRNLISIEGERNILCALDVRWGKRFFLINASSIIALQIDEKDDRVILGFLAPCDVSFIGALSETYDSLWSCEAVDEELGFFIFKGGAE